MSFIGNNSGPPTGTKSSAEGRRIAKPSVEQSIAPLEKKRRLIKNIIGNEKTLVGHIIAITDNSMAYDLSNCLNIPNYLYVQCDIQLRYSQHFKLCDQL